jgi:O-antigen/teichoic acid export membrane protein
VGGISITAIAGCAVVFIFFRKAARPDQKVKTITHASLLKTSLPMMVSTLMTLIIGQTGVLLIGVFQNEADAGYYSVAVKLATLTAFILNAVNSMVGPKFAELYHSDKLDSLFYIAKKSAKLIFWTTSPLLIVLLCFGKPILELVFGEEFGVAYWPMFMLIVAQFIHTCSGATGLFMNMTDHQNQFSKIMIVFATTNILLGILLIPLMGINGAAVAGMLSLGGWNVATLVFIKRKYGTTTAYIPRITSVKNHE